MTLDEGEMVEIGDRQTASELGRHKTIEIRESEPSEIEIPKIKAPDLSGYRIQELRAVAASKGVRGSITMKKSELIKKLEWIL
ncbi:hypothetical protein ES703_109053 [subsurface metagenome]